MKKNKYFIDINKNLAILILIVWCIFAFKIITSQIRDIFKKFPIIYSLSLEQKYRLVDGNFYDFIKFCEARTPERADIVFKIVPKEPDFSSQDWFLAEYFIGKSVYYFYPRKIYREESAIPDIKYKIVYNSKAKTFSFYSQ